jgi:hypothetical protein
LKTALPSYPLRAVHLVAVWAYAVSQPVYSLLQANPEFLVVRGSTRAEVVVFALLLTLGVPLLVLAAEWVVSFASRTAADVIHLLALATFAVPFALWLLTWSDPGATFAVLMAIAVSLAAAWAYQRWKPVRSFLTLSIALPVVGLALFLVRVPVVTDDLAGAHVRVGYETPVVVLLLDELPVSSLMTEAGAIDAVRYPSFAKLARSSTWYPRATSVHESSTSAVPAILTGRLPRERGLPTLEHHPENLFTLLGESYAVRAHEAVTYLCPVRYCPRRREPILERLEGLVADVRVGYLHRVLPQSLAKGLPQVGDRWGGFEQERILVARDPEEIFEILGQHIDPVQDDVDGFLADLDADEPAATIHFLHLFLPHSPWRFLPSGRSYGENPHTDGLNHPSLFWDDDYWLVHQALQRHLLQVGYADRVLGQILTRLESVGLYHRALVVVLADHGVSFVPGGNARKVDGDNIADIARIPLFVKLPGQSSGRVDTRAARTIDVVPTIADVLGVRLPWTIDGRSLVAASQGAGEVAVGRLTGGFVRMAPAEVERGVRDTVRRKSAIFGEGSDSLYAIGPYPELLGSSMAGSRAPASGVRVRLNDSPLFEKVRTSSVFVPTRIAGVIEGADGTRELWLAIAVNGRVAAVTRSFGGADDRRFGAQIPEEALRDGFNRVEILAIERTRSTLRLTHLVRAD